MCGSMVDIQSAAAEIRRGKKRKKKEEDRKHRAKIYGLSYYIGRAAIISQDREARGPKSPRIPGSLPETGANLPAPGALNKISRNF